jgi:hypothetical protein
MFSECKTRTPARLIAQVGHECPINMNPKGTHSSGCVLMMALSGLSNMIEAPRAI